MTQGLCLATPDYYNQPLTLARLWLHEVRTRRPAILGYLTTLPPCPRPTLPPCPLTTLAPCPLAPLPPCPLATLPPCHVRLIKVRRVYGDRLVSETDSGRFDEMVGRISRNFFEDIDNAELQKLPLTFTTFGIDTQGDTKVYFCKYPHPNPNPNPNPNPDPI